MATVRALGRPDFFITFTCNPEWPEIADSIRAADKVQFRNDMVNRVFKGKLEVFLTNLLKNDILGKVSFYNYSIEFQKHGLPHAHILLDMEEPFKVILPTDIDRLISTEIPDPHAVPQLHETIVKHQLHGPCGQLNPNSPCMINGKCSKEYPRSLRPYTIQRWRQIRTHYTGDAIQDEHLRKLCLSEIVTTTAMAFYEDTVFSDNKAIMLSRNDFNACIKKVLVHIEIYLRANNCTIQSFNLVAPPAAATATATLTTDHFNTTRYDEVEHLIRTDHAMNPYLVQYHIDDDTLRNDYIDKLNAEQRSIYNAVMDIIFNDNDDDDTGQKLFFIDAPGGTGKTFLLKTLIYSVEKRQKNVIAVAWTGIAASLLPNGTTAHSAFKLPIPVLSDSNSSVSSNSELGERIRSADLIIWDECSLIEKAALSVIDRLLRDFRQIPPVVSGATEEQVISHSIITHPIWRHFQRRRLITNMGVRNDERQFAQYLLNVGDGAANQTGDILDLSNENFLHYGNEIELINWCYGDDAVADSTTTTTATNFQNNILLTPLNQTCGRLNKIIVEQMPGEYFTYTSTDSIVSDEPNLINRYPVEHLNTITLSGMPHHQIKLKVGCIVMFLRNLNTQIGLVNGVRLIVTKLFTNCIEARVLTGQAKNKTILVPRLDIRSGEGGHAEYEFVRRQLPVALAFAITINKAQYLPTANCTYMAISRATSSRQLKVLITHPQLPQTNNPHSTQNIMYKQLLQQ
ncbi:uncharacterized protein LOC143265402 [Megachile rotundata]|uniref:uncharacterized protein LOC143265402 n=1 Tax=Megachile rotundata TaxID=143995 RepID=UPI003FD5E998